MTCHPLDRTVIKLCG